MSPLRLILRKVVIGLIYAVILFGARWFAYQLRFDFEVPPAGEQSQALATAWMWEIPIKLVLLYFCGQFSGILGFFSLPDLKRLALALGLATLALLVLREAGAPFTTSRGIILSDALLSLAALSSLRLAFRMRHEGFLKPRKASGRSRVGIVGAGDAGAMLAKELLAKPGLGLLPAAFFDDNPKKWGVYIHGIPVVGSPGRIPAQMESLGLERVIIAMPSAPAKRIRELTTLFSTQRIRCETVPGLDQLARGTVQILQLRPIDIGDLLGREAVRINHDNIQEMLRGKTVAVTGAGGSIGQELCRQILGFQPACLLLIDRSEVQLFLIEQELAEKQGPTRLVPLVSDIGDPQQIEPLLREHRPHILYHAAAHKHVPIMERQPAEALRNNSLGTATLAGLSSACGVERFVLISTDKAINPASYMGLSKRLAEIYLQALQTEAPGTKFMAVRFGNVLGSSGSVIPVFQRQIANGGPILVTHPEVSRYFMTIPEAVTLVLQASALGEGGEIFMLDMGQPIKIADLARQLIALQGLRPEEDIEIKFIGLRPGEKLVEEVRFHKENTLPTSHPKILRYKAQPPQLQSVREVFDLIRQMPASTIPEPVFQLVPEYRLQEPPPH